MAESVSSAGPTEPWETKPRSFVEIPRLWFHITKFTKMFFAQEAPRASVFNTLIGVLICIASLSVLSVLSIVLYGSTRGMLGIDASDTESLGLFLGGYVVTGFLVLFYLDNALIYFTARFLGGTGRFVSQVYLVSLFVVPLAVAEGLVILVPSAEDALSFIPLAIGSYAVILSVYRILLTVRTVSVVHQLPTGKAFLAVMWLRLLLLGPLFCVVTYGISQGT